MGQLKLASSGNMPSTSRAGLETDRRGRREVKPTGHLPSTRLDAPLRAPELRFGKDEQDAQENPKRDSAAPPFAGLTSSLRLLVAGLILVALVPNLTLAAIFWLGVINAPWSKGEAPAPAPTETAASVVQEPASVSTAVLTSPPAVDAIAGQAVSFPMALDGTDAVPARSIIAVSGLPAGSSFSEGHPYGTTEWNMKPDEIGDLHLLVPADAAGNSDLTIRLLGPDESVLAEAETILRVAVAAPPQEEQAQPQIATAEQAQPAEVGTPVAGGAETQTSVQPPSLDNANVKWISPSAYVKLREGPSSSSSVLGVVSKGAKLAVMDRKRGWVRVTDPSTAKTGWIYSGNIAGERKPRRHIVRTHAAATNTATQQTETQQSPWAALDQLLSSP